MDFLLSPPPKHASAPQSDRVFVRPPLDGSLTLPEIFNWHHTLNPDHPLFVYRGRDGELTYLTYAQVVPAAHRAARYVAEKANIDISADTVIEKPIAIVAASDTITYATTLFGLLLAGIPVFPITPRFSAAVISHLISITDVSHVFISGEAPIQKIAQEAVADMDTKSGTGRAGISLMPLFEDLYEVDAPLEPLPLRKYDCDSPAIICHSSGSSGFPKPVAWTTRIMLHHGAAMLYGGDNLCGQVVALPVVELFHAIGVFFAISVPTSGYIMATLPPASPATYPSPDAAFQCIIDTNATYAVAPPVIIAAWAENKHQTTALRQLKGIMYGGKPLNKSLGDSLSKKGLTIFTNYGSTETGPVSAVMPDHPGPHEWEYFNVNANCGAEFVPVGDGTYKLIIQAKPTQVLPVINTKLADQDAYLVGDLLLPHPEKAGYWKVLGRESDQIMLSTGETINPCPLENILCQHSLVAGALLFGRGRSQIGVLLELNHEAVPTVEDQEQFRDTIWPIIEELNRDSLKHAPISKQMIVFAQPSKPFSYTIKGIPRRALILEQYQAEVDGAYGNIKVNARAGVPIVSL